MQGLILLWSAPVTLLDGRHLRLVTGNVLKKMRHLNDRESIDIHGLS